MTKEPVHGQGTSHVRVPLGTAIELYDAFSFSPSVKGKNPAALKDAIEHGINQTLLRDCCYGAWAVVNQESPWTWKDDDPYTTKIYGPHENISRFGETLPKFLDAIQLGRRIYASQQEVLEAQRKLLVSQANAANPDRKVTEADYESWYLPPFGLSMIKTDSIQLLHYPPAETLTYMDYLYSPTNRRWESLLGYNGYPGAKNTLVETIVDIAPIAASGGSRGAALIEPLLKSDVFRPYVQKMLAALLRPNVDGTMTQPVVAYGGPVGQWLCKNYGDEITSQGVPVAPDEEGGDPRPPTCSVFTLHLCGADGPVTPVMCANHPIKFNYYDKDYEAAQEGSEADREEATQEADRSAATVLSQDLIAAGWQAQMAEQWETSRDPQLYREVQRKMAKQWGLEDSEDFQELLDIFEAQVQEFSLSSQLPVGTDAWEQQLRDALGS